MDLTPLIAAHSGLDAATAAALTQALREVLADSALHGEAVAIPSVGTFTPASTPEHVVTDASTGVRMMMPPRLELAFRAGSALRKAVTAKPEATKPETTMPETTAPQEEATDEHK